MLLTHFKYILKTMCSGYLGSHKAQGDLEEASQLFKKTKSLNLNFLFLLKVIMEPATKTKQMPLILFAF